MDHPSSAGSITPSQIVKLAGFVAIGATASLLVQSVMRLNLPPEQSEALGSLIAGSLSMWGMLTVMPRDGKPLALGKRLLVTLLIAVPGAAAGWAFRHWILLP